jgi:hypothetical protein
MTHLRIKKNFSLLWSLLVKNVIKYVKKVNSNGMTCHKEKLTWSRWQGTFSLALRQES